MSLQEVKKVLTHGFRDFLVESGFEKPSSMSSEMIFRHRQYPDRLITISTAPMFSNCIFYEFKMKGLDDKQSMFSFSPDPSYYEWPSLGWFEYHDFEELVQVFGFIRRIHLAWMNDLFNKAEVADFIGRLNEIRRAKIVKAASLSREEVSTLNRGRAEKMEAITQNIRDKLDDEWSRAVVEALILEGKLTKRIGLYSIEDSVIRGPQFDQEYRLVDRYIVGPNTEKEYYIVKDHLVGPNGKEPFFLIGNVIFGKTDQMPWFRNRSRAG